MRSSQREEYVKMEEVMLIQLTTFSELLTWARPFRQVLGTEMYIPRYLPKRRSITYLIFPV